MDGGRAKQETPTAPQGKKTRRSSRGPRTRAALVQAALALSSERNIEDLSILDITEAAGLSNSIFYYHFREREDLLELVGKTAIYGLVLEIDEVFREDPAAHIVRGPLVVMRYFDENPQLRSILLRVIEDRDGRHRDLGENLREHIIRGVKAGRFFIEDVEVALRFCRALMGVIVRMRHEGSDDPRLSQIMGIEALQMLGLSPLEARAVLAAEEKAMLAERSSGGPPT